MPNLHPSEPHELNVQNLRIVLNLGLLICFPVVYSLDITKQRIPRWEHTLCNTDPLELTMDHNMRNHRDPKQQQTQGFDDEVDTYGQGVDNFSKIGDGSSGGVAKWPITHSGVDKSDIPVALDKSSARAKSRSGRSHQIARDSAVLLSRAHAAGCTKREKARLFDEFVALNIGPTRAAYLSELRAMAHKRGFKNVEAFVREVVRRDELGHSILDSHVLSLLGEWFSEPAIVDNYDAEAGILIASWRRWDIRSDIRHVLKTSSRDLVFDDDDETQEEGLERNIARSRRVDTEPVFHGTDSDPASEVLADFNEAIIGAANHLIISVSGGSSRKARGFQLLLEELDLLVEVGKLTKRDRSIFVVALTGDASTAGKAVGIKPNAARQAILRTRKKLLAACEARPDELVELKQLLTALEDRSN